MIKLNPLLLSYKDGKRESFMASGNLMATISAYAESNGYEIQRDWSDPKAEVFTEKEAKEIAEQAITNAFVTVQHELGSECGGFASQFTSGEKEREIIEAFRELLESYAIAESSFNYNNHESIDEAVQRHQDANPDEHSGEIDGDGYFINH